MTISEKTKAVKSFHDVLSKSLSKLEAHVNSHPGYDVYRSVRLFDPRQLGMLSHDIEQYQSMPSNELVHEFQLYVQLTPDDIPDTFNVSAFWHSMSHCFPLLAAVAKDAIWMPVASVDVERSFSQYKHLLDDTRESLTEEHTKLTGGRV
ncbi:hypothetical protein LOTGIDRAFT_157260 [Lottia gigantea]|uniref:HAT C-terminal dimerisation domain-containing protein n=1 Tax=Lottia gigantea TaxID=225164 RepID=V4B8K5_LOTGI|nr:hypothetical protein LOTGIDRAFT_157260 [Lottia gigantea]ESP02112.1 hypothetical protein LOTGIDRAFT_157260 [Lottia gigantea]